LISKFNVSFSGKHLVHSFEKDPNLFVWVGFKNKKTKQNNYMQRMKISGEIKYFFKLLILFA